jgi:L-fuconolactonase
METAREPALAICDPHHHLWNRGDSRYLLEELRADLTSGHKVEATVFVECGFGYRTGGPVRFRPVGETDFVVTTDPGGLVAGIVGFADLCDPAIEDILAAHVEAGAGRFRGIRYKIARDPSPLLPASTNRLDDTPLIEDRAFLAGLAACAKAGLSFDTWAYHTQLQELADVARAQPDVTIIIDHLAGPVRLGPYADRREEVVEIWKKRVTELAQYENVLMKLGGVGMPVFGETWHHFPERTTSEQIAAARGPEIRWCIEAFGPDRCMFESNFPVDKHSCSYVVLWNAFKLIAAELSTAEKAALFHDTAQRTYRMTLPA